MNISESWKSTLEFCLLLPNSIYTSTKNLAISRRWKGSNIPKGELLINTKERYLNNKIFYNESYLLFTD